MPEGRRQYTKTQPFQYEEFADCLAWWKKRPENARAWKVSADSILETGCNLDQKNPYAKQDFEHMPPEQLAKDILEKELRIVDIMREIQDLVERKP